MLVYLILIFAILLVFSLSKNKNKALAISFVLITLVAAIRKYTVGADTIQFYRAYTLILRDSSWDYTNFRYEPGFYYLCKILGYINKDAQILIIVTSIFINFSVYRFIEKNSPGYLLSTILYIIMNCFFSNMNIMRQAVALAILLFGFEFLKEKKYIKYILVICIAILFHNVSFAALLLLIFSILPNKKSIYFIEIILALITFLLYKQFFNILTLGFGYSGYATSEYGVSNYFGAVLSALEILLIMLFLFFSSYKKNIKFDNKNIRLFSIAEILYIWFDLLVIRMNIFNRISGLFSIYNIILIPIIFEHMKKYNKDNYKIATTIFFTIYIASFIIISLYRPEWYGVIPYETYF